MRQDGRAEGARSGVGRRDARLCERSEQPEGVAPAGHTTQRPSRPRRREYRRNIPPVIRVGYEAVSSLPAGTPPAPHPDWSARNEDDPSAGGSRVPVRPLPPRRGTGRPPRRRTWRCRTRCRRSSLQHLRRLPQAVPEEVTSHDLRQTSDE